MNIAQMNLKPLVAALLAASVLTACGGGGGGDAPPAQTPGNTQPGGTPPGGGTPGGGTPGQPSATAPAPVNASMVMSCAEGGTTQCSGSTLIRVETNGIGLTSSSVQTYGNSTNDLANPIVNKAIATGFALPTGTPNGTADIRVNKDAAGTVSAPTLILRNLGLSWDFQTERPTIVETFQTIQSRVTLNAAGVPVVGPLPPASDLTHYNWATQRAAATQANYAGNYYFPRAEPSRCPPGSTCPPSSVPETTFRTPSAGDWRTGGTIPSFFGATRLHAEGDIHSGNGVPGPGGAVTILPGGSGPGIPFPGSKGYRSLDNYSLQFSNLAGWVSQDTVELEEWAARNNEHNKNRRGMVAYGQVTDPTAVPTTGTATYQGIAYGWYGVNTAGDPDVFQGAATITVNFATREVRIVFANTATFDAAQTPVPLNLSATTLLGANGTNVAGYSIGNTTVGTLSGGISSRFFGPVTTAGSGTAPAEIAGALRLSGSGNRAVVGGFIARKR